MDSTPGQPSGLVITTEHRSTLEAILDALAPIFNEPGPRILQEQDGQWQRMVLIPSRWCVHDHGPIAREVQDAARAAYRLGAVDVQVMTHELSTRPLRRLSAVAEPI